MMHPENQLAGRWSPASRWTWAGAGPHRATATGGLFAVQRRLGATVLPGQVVEGAAVVSGFRQCGLHRCKAVVERARG